MIRGTKALVTGASRGIGFKIAEMLIKNGCKACGISFVGRCRNGLR